MSYGGGRWNNNRNYNRRGNQGWNNNNYDNYNDYDNQQWRGNPRYNRHNNYNNDYDDSYNDNYNNNYNNQQSRYNNNNRRDKYRKPNNNYQNRTNSNSNSNSNGNQNQHKNITTTTANAATSAAKGNSSTKTNSNVPNGANDETTANETKANANTTDRSPNAQKNKDSKTKEKNEKNEKNNKNEEDDYLDGDDDLDERHEFFDDDDSNLYDLIYYDEDYDECEDYINDWLDDEEVPLTNVQESTLRCYLGSIYSRRDEAFYYAKEEFDKAIKLDNKNDLAYYEYGTMLYELKQYTNALKNYEMAFKLKPDVKEYENDYNDAKKEITTNNLKDEPVPQELIEPPKEDDEDEEDDGDANDNVQGSGGKKEKEKGKGKGKYKKLQGVPEDSEADGGYVDANDNEKENDGNGDGNAEGEADGGDDDEFLDDEDEEEDDYEEDDFETDFERFWDPFAEKWDPDNEYYNKFQENKLDDMKILVTVNLNDLFEKDVLIGKIGMSKEHSSYFMKRLERIQGDNKRFCQWLRSIGLYDEYYSIFEDNEIVTFEAFYYWIQSEDDLLDCIESDTIDENSTDFKLLWETNPRYVRNNPKSDGSLLCPACSKKIVAQAEECAAAAQVNSDEGNNNQGNNDNLNVDQPGAQIQDAMSNNAHP